MCLSKEAWGPEKLRNTALDHDRFRKFYGKGSPTPSMNSVDHKFCRHKDKQYLILITVYFISLEYHFGTWN
jgi:hypothetical protein